MLARSLLAKAYQVGAFGTKSNSRLPRYEWGRNRTLIVGRQTEELLRRQSDSFLKSVTGAREMAQSIECVQQPWGLRSIPSTPV